ncbi:hypothetical protein BC826DRAFT_966938 [Russula brevipes]|nr:hypothetical protein BC826DRAFT_966938 [Russula brevipes]
MSSNAAGSNGSGDELWDVAFSNVGRACGEPIDQEEIAEAIQAISGPNGGNGAADTTHAVQSQLYMDPSSADQQEGSGQQYNFIQFTPSSAHHDAAGQDTITIGTDGMAANTPPYPTKTSGIPGRRGHLVPGSSRPWRVNERTNNVESFHDNSRSETRR